MDQRKLVDGFLEIRRRIDACVQPERNLARLQVCPVVRRCACENAVVVLGVALCFGERLMTTARATGEIAVPRRIAIKRTDDRLRLHRHLVDAAMGPVVDEARVQLAVRTDHPGGITTAALVPGIGGGDCITFRHRRSHRLVLNRAEQCTQAHALEAAIPVRKRHPYLEVDGRLNGTGHTAEGRLHDDRIGLGARDGEAGLLDGLCQRDARVRQRLACKRCAPRGDIASGVCGQCRVRQGTGNGERERHGTGSGDPHCHFLSRAKRCRQGARPHR